MRANGSWSEFARGERALAAAAGGVALLLAGTAIAAGPKGVRFLNLTGRALTEVSLTPAGTDDFGPNQCLHAPTGAVAADADLAIRGVPPGRYDLRLTDEHGRSCLVRNVDVQNGATFSARAPDLVDCAP